MAVLRSSLIHFACIGFAPPQLVTLQAKLLSSLSGHIKSAVLNHRRSDEIM